MISIVLNRDHIHGRWSRQARSSITRKTWDRPRRRVGAFAGERWVGEHKGLEREPALR
jgi:hypothetical protein